MEFVEGISKIVLGYSLNEKEVDALEKMTVGAFEEAIEPFCFSEFKISKFYKYGKFLGAYFGYVLSNVREYNPGDMLNLDRLLEEQIQKSGLVEAAANKLGIERKYAPSVYHLAGTSD